MLPLKKTKKKTTHNRAQRGWFSVSDVHSAVWSPSIQTMRNIGSPPVHGRPLFALFFAFALRWKIGQCCLSHSDSHPCAKSRRRSRVRTKSESWRQAQKEKKKKAAFFLWKSDAKSWHTFYRCICNGMHWISITALVKLSLIGGDNSVALTARKMKCIYTQ